MQWNQMQKRCYRKWLIIAIVVVFAVLLFFVYAKFRAEIPNELVLFQGENSELSFSLPVEGKLEKTVNTMQIQNGSSDTEGKIHFSMGRQIKIQTMHSGTAKASLRLFGIIPLKQMHFTVIHQQKVMPSGRTIGLYLATDGMMVLGTGEVNGKNGVRSEPAKNILQTGDYIKTIDGKKAASIQMASNLINHSMGKMVVLTLLRGKNMISVKIQPVLDQEGNYKIGAWLREDTEGIGTLSFVSERNEFAALGHGITDADTGLLVHLNQGNIYPARIEQIVKGKAGNPGEVIGNVELADWQKVGTITKNSELGIQGKITNTSYGYEESKALPIGLKQEVTKGMAYIYCQLGEEVEKYPITIIGINHNSKDNKGMEISIPQGKLCNKTGGIIQGMSGSPIIQNGKVIGAVTHVFVDDPTKGYGTFIENMIRN